MMMFRRSLHSSLMNLRSRILLSGSVRSYVVLYSSISAIGNERIESLIQEDQNVKRRRERYQKQSSLHENRAAAAASTWSDNGGGTGFSGFRQKSFGATSSFGATRHLSSSASSLPPSEEKAKRQWEKEKILEKLCSPEADLNLILQDHKKKGITKADLFSWAKALHMDCKSQYALKILEWVDQKKFKFSPSQLELYVDILCKIKGVESGTTCFDRLKPDFDQNNTRARNNSPAFWTLITWMQIEMDMDARPKPRPLILTSTREAVHGEITDLI